jgi:hypothetical protein
LAALALVVGCADPGQYHVQNTQQAYDLFIQMRSDAKERAEDWLRAENQKAVMQYYQTMSDPNAPPEQKAKALQTLNDAIDANCTSFALDCGTREMLSDDLGIWLTSQAIEATLMQAGQGLAGNIAKQIGRGAERVAKPKSKADEPKK